MEFKNPEPISILYFHEPMVVFQKAILQEILFGIIIVPLSVHGPIEAHVQLVTHTPLIQYPDEVFACHPWISRRYHGEVVETQTPVEVT